MVGIPGLYFVIVSDDRARFVRPDSDDGLHTIKVISFTSANEGDAAATGPPDDVRRTRFARQLATRLEDDFAADLFSHLVLVAPPRMLRIMIAILEPTIGACLFGSLAKDLIGTPDLELWPHVFSWLRPGEVSSTIEVPSRGWQRPSAR